MKKLMGIISSIVVCTIIWALISFLALGASANCSSALWLGILSGGVTGLGCAVSDKTNPILMGITVPVTFWFSVSVTLLIVGTGPFPALTLEILVQVVLTVVIGAASGFGYKMAVR